MTPNTSRKFLTWEARTKTDFKKKILKETRDNAGKKKKNCSAQHQETREDFISMKQEQYAIKRKLRRTTKKELLKIKNIIAEIQIQKNIFAYYQNKSVKIFTKPKPKWKRTYLSTQDLVCS